ncbi:mitochondrial import inner membrane translocase subunit Tim13-B-like [Varroa jacobsoni]|uniref:Mitochondrial import inner membrane translocase subunit n=1 Tax=Varroa destructor TaxID=109461 RepID=A0A7M7JL17_VARDE|nr:mitochondrial import inner membrane translocase subunit Tim13-B-like [Varroa destructor]XP_022692102.1 mitochondrial import inner membrane translocase subunit Tim13-B-like [Varroa jacobsoni]
MASLSDSLPAGGNITSAQKEDIMDQVKQSIAIANAQELLQKMTEKCFQKCVVKPGSSIDNSEQKCLSMCMDRYMDSWNIVSRTYSTRIQRERDRN